MQLIDTLTLPTAQFTSLSILLQLHHEDFSPTVVPDQVNEDKVQQNSHDAPDEDQQQPTLHQCHSLTSDKPKYVPVYPENSKVYYTTTQSIDDGDDEQANATTVKEATVLTVHYDDLLVPYYTILVDGVEKQTDNSHLSSSSGGNIEEADRSAGLTKQQQRRRTLSHSVLRHDLTTLSPFCLLSEEMTQSSLECLHTQIMIENGMRDDFCNVGQENVMQSTSSLSTQTVNNEKANEKAEDESRSGNSGTMKRKGVSFRQDTKAGKLETAQPTPGSVVEKEGGQTNNNNIQGLGGILPVKVYKPPSHFVHCHFGLNLYYVQINIEDVMTREDNEDTIAFRRIMAVLLPDCSLEVMKPIITGKEKQCGVILLTVAITGPAYDLYGSSSLLVNLPSRLREGIHMLTAVDTTIHKKEEAKTVPSSSKSGGDGKLKKGKSNKSIGISYFNRGEEEPTKKQTAVVYDSAYFQRLYTALLATIMDDEDGLLRDHDALALNHNIPLRSQSLASNNRVKGNTSKSRSKLFTFTRKTNKTQKYESGDSVDGDVIPLEIDMDRNRSENNSSNAEIMRQTALQMEILSLVDDDMPLPKYEHIGENERKRMQAKSPKVGGGGTFSLTSGRFGRKETTFDLAGFEYRPNFGAGSVSGTASTMASSDEASMVTGDETATMTSKFTMLSNASSVPTLSKSKKDSGARSSRFKFLQKRKKESAAKTPPTNKPQLSLQTKQIPTQEVFDPFCYDGDGVIEEEQEDSVASGSTKETAEQQVMGAVSRSFSGDESEGATTLPTLEPTVFEDERHNMNMVEPEEEEMPVPTRHMSVDLALNEDLTCEYKKSKLSSISVDGTLQIRVKHQDDPQTNDMPQEAPTPFLLLFHDHSHHIKSLQENKRFVQKANDAQSASQEYTYSIALPRDDEYFPVVKYKCSNKLRPVPIRVQSRVRTQGSAVRVALQISSNPQNPSDLVHLSIIMGVPKDVVKGQSLQCNPPGGSYNSEKSVVLWCVSELGEGEKFQLQAVFELQDEYANAHNDADATSHLASKLEFPVLARCQCSGFQLSDVEVDVVDMGDQNNPAEITGNIIRRFRVSHKEK